MAEKKLQNDIIKYLKSNHIYYLKIHNGGYMVKGTPDLLICYKGLFIALELKDLKGVVSVAQLHQLKRIEDSGGISKVIYTYTEFIDLFNTL